MIFNENDICVSDISEDGLEKYVYVFNIKGVVVTYTSYWVVRRSSRTEPWIDTYELPKPFSYTNWCRFHGYTEERCEYPHDDYDYVKYCDTFNPVCQKTAQGKTKLFGLYTKISDLPPCPEILAKCALSFAKDKLKVKYQ